MPNTTVPATATGLPEDTTGPFTRRTILAAIAASAIPVAAVPALAASGEDAGLLAAGREFDRLIAAWAPLSCLLDECEEALAAACTANGFPQNRYGHVDVLGRYDEYMALRRSTGADDAAEACEAAALRIDAAAAAARSHTPQTVAGLAVLARVARWNWRADTYGEKALDDDFGEQQIATFLDLVEAFAAGRPA
jgi:hypothetical protein